MSDEPAIEAAPADEAKPRAPELPGGGTRDGALLREAMRAFEVGDYVRVRARCDDLKNARDEAVRTAAAELRARTEIDRVQVAVIGACAVGLLAIVAHWVL